MELARREFLGMGAALGLGACGGRKQAEAIGMAPSIAAGVNASARREESGLPASSPAVHLLRRCTWGVTPADLSHLATIGRQAWIEEQLAYQALDDSAVEREVRMRWTSVHKSGCQLAQLKDTRKVMQDLRAATIFRRVFSPRQLYEVMVDFWTDHFTVYHGDGIARIMKTVDDREVIRPHALGSFRNMLHASARSPAMLEYLDNRRSRKGRPNENYARELMELHTLGVNGGYSEDDIKNVARALTGWTVAVKDNPGLCLDGGHLSFTFAADQHDAEEKWVLGQHLPAGRGIEDGIEVLDLLVDHPATRTFIARKLCQRLIADTPDDTTVAKVAAAWGADGDIPAMLRVLLDSAAFAQAQDAKLSRPQEFAIAVVRALEPQMDQDLTLLDLLRTAEVLELYSRLGLTQIEQLPRLDYAMLEPLDLDLSPSYEGIRVDSTLARTGHVPFQWPSPDGYPDFAAYWASTNGLLERWKFALQAAHQTRGENGPSNAEYLAGKAASARDIVAALVAGLSHRPLSGSVRELLIAQAAGDAAPDEPLTGNRRIRAAKDVMALLLISPYHQYR